jgi:SAM-dependent methyltransferase
MVHMTAADLRLEFARRGPWVTKFTIDSEVLGGDYDGDNWRVQKFFDAFPEVTSILELGCLEGGQSFALASRPNVSRVTAVEGRTSNIEKARFVQSLIACGHKVQFVQADLEHADLRGLGEFDAVFCCGLLYHLVKPWRLLGQCTDRSSRLFLWTHYAASAETSVDDIEGRWYTEAGPDDPLSGLSERAFWPTREGLLQMLTRAGYSTVKVIRELFEHENGPAITLAATHY